MTESIIGRVRLLLVGLRREIYSLTFIVDLRYVRWLQKQRDLVKKRGLPSRKAFLDHPKYEAYRQELKDRGPQATWPEHAENAFFEGM